VPTRFAIFLVFLPLLAQVQSKTVWDGVYTSSQADRGESAFAGTCTGCHQSGFQGQRFIDHWREGKLSNLYSFISTSMPPGNKTPLDAQDYVDIVAYILKSNKFPAGNAELTADATEGIQVVGKDGPAGVPDGALVSLVGCLAQDADKKWSLTNASEPVRTADVDKSTDLKALEAKPLGSLTFLLPDVSFYKPAAHKGHKVELKGFLDKEPKGDRVLATALQTVAPLCP
jgi:S-disulfanyl-L-cysteine oxidoreductase SoxD